MSIAKRTALIFLSLGLILALALTAVLLIHDSSGGPNEGFIMHASWAKSYSSIQELAEASDFIGLVEIVDRGRSEEAPLEESGEGTPLSFSTFSAKVLDGIVSEKDTIEIFMTGRHTDKGVIQFSDDPLMSEGEKWFIFARKNDDGTYTILGGPCGRFSYNEKGGTITALNLVNPAVKDAKPDNGVNLQDASLEAIKKEIQSSLDAK